LHCKVVAFLHGREHGLKGLSLLTAFLCHARKVAVDQPQVGLSQDLVLFIRLLFRAEASNISWLLLYFTITIMSRVDLLGHGTLNVHPAILHLVELEHLIIVLLIAGRGARHADILLTIVH
jgi:hypothetical protein